MSNPECGVRRSAVARRQIRRLGNRDNEATETSVSRLTWKPCFESLFTDGSVPSSPQSFRFGAGTRQPNPRPPSSAIWTGFIAKANAVNTHSQEQVKNNEHVKNMERCIVLFWKRGPQRDTELGGYSRTSNPMTCGSRQNDLPLNWEASCESLATLET